MTSITAEKLATLVEGELLGDAEKTVTGAQSLDSAGPDDLAFAGDLRNLKLLELSRAGVVLVPSPVIESTPPPSNRAFIGVDDPQTTFMKLLVSFRPQRSRSTIGVSPAAHVADSATIGEDTNVYPGAHIDAEATVGAGCDIHPGVVIGPGCRIGNGVTLHPNVVIYNDVLIGDRVTIHAGCVIGADGYGYRQVEGRHEKIPQLGTVRIEDDVEIGACSTVDRAMIGETVIGEGTKIDNHVMIAHNCQLGRHNLIVSQVGFAGSVTTGDYVVCAGQVGVADHLHLADGCVLGAKSAVHSNVPAGETWFGYPARPKAEAAKAATLQTKLPQFRQQIRKLQDQIDRLNAQLAGTAEGPRRKAA